MNYDWVCSVLPVSLFIFSPACEHYTQGHMNRLLFLRMSSVYIHICLHLHHTFHLISVFSLHTAAQPLPGPSQVECAPAIMMASMCGVLKQPAKREIAALAPCILGLGSLWLPGLESSPSTMTAAGSVACGGEISDGQSVILRGKGLVYKVSQWGLIIGRKDLCKICSECGGELFEYRKRQNFAWHRK